MFVTYRLKRKREQLGLPDALLFILDTATVKREVKAGGFVRVMCSCEACWIATLDQLESSQDTLPAVVSIRKFGRFSVLHKRSNGRFRLSFAKTRSPLVSTTWEMECNVVEPGYMRPMRGILESDDFLAKDRRLLPLRRRQVRFSAQRPVDLCFGLTSLFRERRGYQ